MSDTTTEPLYKAGTWLVMNSRFRSNQNIDLGTLQPFFDFSPSNFTNPSTNDLDGMIISRDGVFNPLDTNITPNMDKWDVVANWRWNFWIGNTFVWWRLSVTTEVTTTINTQGVFEVLDWVWTSSDLEHFDEPVNWQLRHLWIFPREFRVVFQSPVDWNSNQEIAIRVRKYDSSTTTTSTIFTQTKQINNLIWWRDVAFFDIIANVELDINDYVFLEVANNSWTQNVTAELDGFLLVEARW